MIGKFGSDLRENAATRGDQRRQLYFSVSSPWSKRMQPTCTGTWAHSSQSHSTLWPRASSHTRYEYRIYKRRTDTAVLFKKKGKKHNSVNLAPLQSIDLQKEVCSSLVPPRGGSIDYHCVHQVPMTARQPYARCEHHPRAARRNACTH
eukprot:COSAG02_NODE_376_length_23555_cov_31.269185_3_plen_148_part_00